MNTSGSKQRLNGLAIAVEAVLMLTAASVRIATVRSDRLVHVLGSVGPARVAAEPTPAERLSEQQRVQIRLAMRIGRIVERIARLLPWDATCLRQSLATRWMLDRRNIDALIHLGVADVESMDAHAWVTVDSRVVNGRVGRPFNAVASFHA